MKTLYKKIPYSSIYVNEGIHKGILTGNSINKKIEYILNRSILSLVFIILMWLSANSFFYLPFTPVPVTMQVMTVIISALTMGGYWAALTQIEYILLGIAGLPVFAGFKSGIAAITGPTGGYIIGFVIASFITGIIFKKIKNINSKHLYRNNKLAAFIAGISGILIIYSTGYLHLLGYMYSLLSYPDFNSLFLSVLNISVIPFFIFDITKIIIILFIVRSEGIKN